MNAVEINSSFYRFHRRTTYERWADATPDDFRFSVKVPRAITHAAAIDLTIVDRFVEEATGLGPKLSVLLIQLPPSRVFDPIWAERVYDAFRLRTSVALAVEPRHASWFDEETDRWLAARNITRVAADPARAKDGDRPGGCQGLCYFRLHGAPRIYYSSYDEQELAQLSERLFVELETAEVWCIFDNTAQGAAMENAMWIKTYNRLRSSMENRFDINDDSSVR